MKNKFTLIVFLSILCFELKAQRFEIGAEGGPMSCFYKINDPSGNLETIPCISGYFGINVRYNTKKKIFFEAGILKAEYTDGLKLKQQFSESTGNHDEVLLFPIRAGYPLSISKRVSFVPSIGLTPVYKTLNQDGGFVSIQESTPNGILRYEYKWRNLGKDFYFLINGNATVEWQFHKRLKAAVGLSYYHGFTEVSIADVKYRIHNNPEQSALLISKGSFLGYMFGVKYILKNKPVSNK